jgi:hypothetical protein
MCPSVKEERRKKKEKRKTRGKINKMIMRTQIQIKIK